MDIKNKQDGVIDFDYIKALKIIDPNYINRVFISLRGGNSDHIKNTPEWYRINNTDVLVNLYLDHNKKKFYALSIAKLQEELLDENMRNLKIDDSSYGGNKTDYRKPGKKPKSSTCPPKSPGRPKIKDREEENSGLYENNYEHSEEYGGKKKGRKPKKDTKKC